MALKMKFAVSRKGETPQICTALLPYEEPEDLLGFAGGKIKVVLPGGKIVEADLTSAFKMAENNLAVQLQNEVRDVLFPTSNGTGKSRGRSYES